MMEGISNYQIYHCDQDNHNKIWGWCQHGDHFWAFWGAVGKSCSFKHHGTYVWDIHHVSNKKLQKGYKPIRLEHMLMLDPNFSIMFQERFVACLLQTPI